VLFYSNVYSTKSDLDFLEGLWVLEKEHRSSNHANPEEEATTDRPAYQGASSSTTEKRSEQSKSGTARDGPQRISINDNFHIKHALSGLYLTLTDASSFSAAVAPSFLAALPFVEVVEPSTRDASPSALRSGPSQTFASSSSRSLQLLLNQQRHAREEWEEAEKKRMQGNNQQAVPRKNSGFLSHQRDTAQKREHIPEYHLALIPTRDKWTRFSFYHPFTQVPSSHSFQSAKITYDVHAAASPPAFRMIRNPGRAKLVALSTWCMRPLAPAFTRLPLPSPRSQLPRELRQRCAADLHSRTRMRSLLGSGAPSFDPPTFSISQHAQAVFRGILAGGMEKVAAEKRLLSVHPLSPPSSLPTAIAKAHSLFDFFHETVSSVRNTTSSLLA
jgi:hypothetical protein